MRLVSSQHDRDVFIDSRIRDYGVLPFIIVRDDRVAFEVFVLS